MTHESAASYDPSLIEANTAAPGPRNEDRTTDGRSPTRDYLEVIIAIGAVTTAGRFVPFLGYEAFGHIYLFTVIALSLRVGRRPALLAAVVSAVAWDFVFLPPQMSFSILQFDDALLLGTYFVVALIGSQLTARSRAQEREARQRELLAASDRLHRTLLDSVSHELKTPLSVLRSATEKLGTVEPEKQARLVDEIGTATHRLDRLVANLLNQTRLESGALRPQPDWCDARDLIAAARRAVDDALGGHIVVLEIPGDLPLFRADSPLMEQVLINLLLNAARYTPAGSRICVTAGRQHGRIFIAIADNGPGLPSEIVANPFQKFRPGHHAGAGGLGLGLSIVRGFMLAQGGDVVAGSSPEGGACFTIQLPYRAHGDVPEDDS